MEQPNFERENKYYNRREHTIYVLNAYPHRFLPLVTDKKTLYASNRKGESDNKAAGPWVLLHLPSSRVLRIGFKVHQEMPSNHQRDMNPILLREPQSDSTKPRRHWPSHEMLAEPLHQSRMVPLLTDQEILQKRCCGERETAAARTGHCKRSRRMPIFEEIESPMAQKPSQQKQGDSLPFLCWYWALPALSVRNQFRWLLSRSNNYLSRC